MVHRGIIRKKSPCLISNNYITTYNVYPCETTLKFPIQIQIFIFIFTSSHTHKYQSCLTFFSVKIHEVFSE